MTELICNLLEVINVHLKYVRDDDAGGILVFMTVPLAINNKSFERKQHEITTQF